MTLTATDTGGSRVRTILYSTEAKPEHYQAYTGPFPLQGSSHVTAFASDWAGNTEYPPAVRSEVMPAVYLPLVIR